MALPKKVIQLFLPKQIIKNLKSFSPIQKTWFLPIQVETIPELKGYTLPPGKLPNGITLPNNNYDDDDIELMDILDNNRYTGDNCFPVNVEHFEWKETCQNILKKSLEN